MLENFLVGARKYFELTDNDRAAVAEIIKKGGKGRSISRAIVLKMKDKNFTNIEAAEVAEVTPRTVINICQYYETGGLDSALNDDSRPGQPAKLDDRIKVQIIAMVCSNPPEGFDRWTLELLKEKAEEQNIVNNISKESIRLILKEHDLKPWQYKMWCVPSINDVYKDRMNEILDVYEKDYNIKEPVLCLDEKPVALFGDVRKMMPFGEGKANRMDYEYTRNGSVNVFCAVEPLKGIYFNKVTERRTGKDFAFFLREIYEFYKNSSKVHLVMDNLSTHFKKPLVVNFGEEEGGKIWNKFEVHYTPTHASWLNQAEIAIGMYSRQCLGKTRIDDIELLKKKTESWNRIINEKNVTINWRVYERKSCRKIQTTGEKILKGQVCMR